MEYVIINLVGLAFISYLIFLRYKESKSYVQAARRSNQLAEENAQIYKERLVEDRERWEEFLAIQREARDDYGKTLSIATESLGLQREANELLSEMRDQLKSK